MDHFINNLFGITQKLLVIIIPFLLFSTSSVSKASMDSQFKPEIFSKAIAQIPFKISSGLIQIEVRINDSKRLKMYLDSGMSAPIVVLFHKELIEEIGLTNTQQVALAGAGNEEQKLGTMAPGAVLRFSGVEMVNQTIVVFDESRENSDWYVDGIIGKTIFDSYITEIDYENLIIKLYDRNEFQINECFYSIPLTLEMGMPFVEASVNLNGKKEIPVKLIFDLGHRNALFLMNNSEQKILPPPGSIKSAAGRGVQGEVLAEIGKISKLKLGPYTFNNVLTSFVEGETNVGLSQYVMDGDLGQLIFRRFNIIMDYANKQIYLAPNKYFNEPFEFNMAGLLLEQDKEERYYVRYVVEDSPALRHGILKGDKLLTINGKNMSEFNYYEISDIFRKEGSELELTIKRGEKLLKKKFNLVRLL